MQPESPQKPIMDVAAPPKPTNGALPVHEAPADTVAAPSTSEQPAPAAPQPVVKAKSPKPAKVSGQSGPVVAIVFALLAMGGLSALAVAVYLKT